MFNDDLSLIVGCNNSGKTSTLYSISEILNIYNNLAWIYFNKKYEYGENFKKVSNYQFRIDSYGLGEIPFTHLSNDIKTIEIIKEYIQKEKIDYLIIDDFHIMNSYLQKIILDLPVKKIISFSYDLYGYDDIETTNNISGYNKKYYYLNIYDQMSVKTIRIDGSEEIILLDDYIKSLKRETKLNNLLNGKEEY
jgi:hypothetical protein